MSEEVIPFQNENEYYAAVFENIRDILHAYDDYLKQPGSDFRSPDDEDIKVFSTRYRKRLQQLAEKRFDIFQRASVCIRKQQMIIPAYVIKTFCTDDFMTHCFLMALAGQLDSGFGALYAGYPENDNQIHPTLDFCIRTYTPFREEQIRLLEQYYADVETRWNLLFDPAGSDDRFPLYRRLFLRSNIISFIMDFSNPENVLSDFCRFIYPAEVKRSPSGAVAYAGLIHKLSLKQPTLIVYLSGKRGSGRKKTAAIYFSEKSKPCMFIDFERISDKLLPEVLGEAKLKAAGICLWNIEKFQEKQGLTFYSILEKFLLVSPVLFIAGEDRFLPGKCNFTVPVVELDMGYPSLEERKALWKEALEKKELCRKEEVKALIDELSLRFIFTPGQIEEAAEEAYLLSAREGFQEELIYQACFRQVTHRLGEKAMRICGHYTWNDLILPPSVKQQLQDACNQIKYHGLVYDSWGFEDKIAYGRGVSMLFNGAPGTGKTMAAQVIANYLHMELYKVELSTVMSKYIGETQKALNELFDEVKKSQSILFFDEADALFAKRSEVKGANDRYANSETAYLLQKMEEYEGIVILATNYIQNFDTAFKRRIKVVIEFQLPAEEERLAIWKNIFPAKAPQEEVIDYKYLAKNFSLSGSNIKNAAVAAAFRAAARGRGIRMEDILLSIRNEIGKSGKQMNLSEFREYAYMIEESLNGI